MYLKLRVAGPAIHRVLLTGGILLISSLSITFASKDSRAQIVIIYGSILGWLLCELQVLSMILIYMLEMNCKNCQEYTNKFNHGVF